MSDEQINNNPRRSRYNVRLRTRDNVRIRTQNTTRRGFFRRVQGGMIVLRDRVRPELSFLSPARQELDTNNNGIIQVNRDLAMPDKLEIVFPNVVISSFDDDNLNAHLYMRNYQDTLLKVPRRFNDNKFTCYFRKNACPFLYGSSIEFVRKLGSRYELEIKLRFNPTRVLGNLCPESSILFDFCTDRSNLVKSRTLDHNDNFILEDSGNFEGFLNNNRDDQSLTFRQFLVELTRLIEIKLIDEIEDATFQFDWSNWSISSSEVYYEFKPPNAFQFMKSITPHIAMLYRQTSFRHYFADENDSEEGGNRFGVGLEIQRKTNSYLIQIPLSYGLVIVIYPKTTQVVRFELRCKGSLRHVLGRLFPDLFTESHQGTNAEYRRRFISRTFGRDLENIPEILTHLSMKLADIIDEILGEVRDANSIGDYNINIVPDFIRMLDEYSPNQLMSNRIWENITVNGCIKIRTRRSPYYEVLNRLAMDGIYIIADNSREYNWIYYRLSGELLNCLRALRFDPTFGRLDELE